MDNSILGNFKPAKSTLVKRVISHHAVPIISNWGWSSSFCHQLSSNDLYMVFYKDGQKALPLDLLVTEEKKNIDNDKQPSQVSVVHW